MSLIHAAKNRLPKKPLEPLIVDAIIRRIQPQRIILFGSRARGDAQERADYDIAIDDETLTPALLAQIRAEVEELRSSGNSKARAISPREVSAVIPPCNFRASINSHRLFVIFSPQPHVRLV